MSTKSVEEQASPEGPWERSLLQAVRSLRYGSVEVVVHEGRVVQIETREKVRFADERRPDDRRPNDIKERGADRKPGSTTQSEETSK